MQANAERDPHGVFSQSADQKVTYTEAFVMAKKIAFEMRRLGVKAGHVVALDMPDQLCLLFTEAVFHEAAMSTVLPKGYQSEGSFKIDWIFSSGNATPQREAKIVKVDARFLQRVDQNPYGIRPSEEPIDILRIAFSSGTTGNARAISFSRKALVPFDDERTGFDGYPFLVLMDFATLWGFGGFYHSVVDSQPFLSVGGAKPHDVVRIAAQNSVASLRGSPAQIVEFVGELEKQQRTVPSIDRVYVGGTVMPPGLAERMRHAAEGCRIISMYGSTEARIATNRLYESEDATDAGTILPYVNLEIVDEQDRVLPDGQPGRIRYQSPGMVHEYLGDPEATRSAFKDGWFYPGDLGLIRPGRGLTLTGRESELLNAGGVKVDPTRLDHFALQNPDIADACSFEYLSSSGLRKIGIALVTDGNLDVHALAADFTLEFESAAPTLIARTDAIPRNTMGKPMRRILAEQYGED